MDIISIKNECDRLVRNYAQKFGNPDIVINETKQCVTWKIVLQVSLFLSICEGIKRESQAN